MIVAALAEYYDRLATEAASKLPQYGWSTQKIGFVIVLERDGALHAVNPPPVDDRVAARRFTLTVPGQSKPTGTAINPCFLWDNPAYALGLPPEDKEPGWAWERFEHFKSHHLDREREIDDPAFSAVCRFLADWTPVALERAASQLEQAHGFGVFRLRGAREYVHERPAVVAHWNRSTAAPDPDAVEATSLLSGRREVLARLHEPKIKGVRGGQSSGTLLASFNCKAFDSYGRQQGHNAPIGQREAFRYCTALNTLLADERRRTRVGDTTAVFWSERPHPIEDITGAILAGIEDEGTVQRVAGFLNAMKRGAPHEGLEDASTRFFVLGLAPNAARLAVRFWLEGSVAEFAERLRHHAAALELDGAPPDYVFPSIRRLVEETAPVSSKGWPDSDRVSRVLVGEMTRAILGGLAYPRSLLVGVVQRLRAEGFVDNGKRKQWRQAMHRRASILKACLTRGTLHSSKEVPMKLNDEHPDVAYQLGRLFAVLEKTQEEALGKNLNASVRDRYLGAASATPSTVLPRLWRLHAHHLRKLENPGRRVNLERLVASICARFQSIPSHLPIEGQGLFFLGYYQQRQDLYTSKRETDAITATD